MTSKGHDSLCCCDGCHHRPVLYDTTGMTLPQIRSLTSNCCTCVPLYVCVTVLDSSGNSGTAIFKAFCPTGPVGDIGFDQPLYQILGEFGGVSVNGQIIDLVFWLRGLDGVCTLSVSSSALDVKRTSPGAAVVIDADSRNASNRWCQTAHNKGKMYTEFLLNQHTGTASGTSSASSGHWKVRLTAADHLPIRGRPNCRDKDGQIVPDRSVLKDLCCNCKCIARCMCLTIGSSDGSYQAVACISDETGTSSSTYTGTSISRYQVPQWKFSNGVVVTLGPRDGVSNVDLIACWDFDERSGTRRTSFGVHHLIDDFGIGHTAGVINNAAAFGTHSGPTGTTLPGYLQAPLAYDLSLTGISFQASFWVRLNTLTQDMAIVSKTVDETPGGFSWRVWYRSSDNSLNFTVSDGAAFTTVQLLPGLVSVAGFYFFSAQVDVQHGLIILIVNGGDHPGLRTSAPFTGVIPITYGPFTVGGTGNASNPMLLDGAVDQGTIYATEFDRPFTGVSGIASALWNNGHGLSCHPDDRCYLWLTVPASSGYVLRETPAPVLVGDDSENKCPRPTANWALSVEPTTHIPSIHEAIFDVTPHDCGDPCTAYAATCCPDGRTTYPTILHATVETSCPTTGTASGSDDGCSRMTIDLVWKGFLWVGHGKMCGHDINLSIGCPFQILTFDASPCVGGTHSDLSASCDPVLAVFNFNTGGIGCCGGSSVGTVNFIVTITE